MTTSVTIDSGIGEAGRPISRVHAVVEIRDLTYVLEDMKSTNGTLVNDEKIVGPVELLNQGEFQIGGTTIMLIVTEEG